MSNVLPCMRCTGVNEAHFLTCPTLNLPSGWYKRTSSDEYSDFWEEGVLYASEQRSGSTPED